MLAKSKTSALILALLFGTATAITTGLLVAIRHLAGTNDFEAATSLAGDGAIEIQPAVALALLIPVLGLSLAVLARMIYMGDGSHFGSRGAIRWAVSGALFGLLICPISIVLARLDAAQSAWLAALGQTLRMVWAVLAFGLSYRLVFKRGFRKQDAVEGREISPGLRARQPVDARGALAIIRTSPEARSAVQQLSWFLIGGGLLMLIIGLVAVESANPYVLPSLVAIGLAAMATGGATRSYVRQSRIAPWFMLLSFALFVAVLYTLVRLFTYSS